MRGEIVRDGVMHKYCVGLGATVKTDGQPWDASGEEQHDVTGPIQDHRDSSTGNSPKHSCSSASRHWNLACVLACFYITSV